MQHWCSADNVKVKIMSFEQIQPVQAFLHLISPLFRSISFFAFYLDLL